MRSNGDKQIVSEQKITTYSVSPLRDTDSQELSSDASCPRAYKMTQNSAKNNLIMLHVSCFRIAHNMNTWVQNRAPQICVQVSQKNTKQEKVRTPTAFMCDASVMVAICERSPHSAKKVRIKD